MITINLWAKVLLVLWWQVQLMTQGNEEAQVTTISSKTGIYFDHIGFVYFYPSEWSLVTYVDLNPIRDLWKNTKAQFVNLMNLCESVKNESWYPYTDCKPSISYFQSKRKIVDRLKDIVSDLVGNDQNRNEFRQKRGILDFVGNILNILFGTATEDEINKYTKHIQTLESEHKDFLRVTKEQLLVLKSTILTMNSTIRNADKNEKKLKEVIIKLANETRSTENSLKKELEISLQINEYITQIQRGIEECQHTFDLLIDVYLHSQDGILQPQIITLQTIKDVMLREIMPEQTMFPPFPSSELLSLLRPIIYTQHSYLVYVIKIPLLNENRFELYKSIPFPVLMNVNLTAAFISTQKEYIFSDSLRQHYGKIDSSDLAKCFQPNELNYVCAETIPINTYIADYDCEATLLHPNNMKIPNSCVTKILPLQHTLWIPLHMSNEWLYVAPREETFTTICKSERVQHKIKGRGKVQLGQTCHGLTSTSVLYPISHFKSNNSKDDILPLPTLDIDCCITIHEQEKIKDIPLSIPLNNILSSVNDLNIAGYRVEEVTKLIEEREKQSHKTIEYLYSWKYYFLTFCGLIIFWILGCCCCKPCRECSKWLFKRCSPRQCYEDCKQVTIYKYNNVNSISNNYGNVDKQENQGASGGIYTALPPSPIPSTRSLPLPGPSAPGEYEMVDLNVENKLRRSSRLKNKIKEPQEDTVLSWKRM